MSNVYPVKLLEFTFIVPVAKEKNLDLSNQIFYSMLSISGIIIITLMCAYIFKFEMNEWSAFNIYSFILGLGIDMDPRRSLRCAIIFFTIFVVSFFFISDLVSDSTAIKYKNIEVPIIESFEDILTKNITVIFPYSSVVFNLLKDSAFGIIQNIAQIAIVKQNNEAYSYQKIFIFDKTNAEKILIRNNSILDGIKHKISDLILCHSFEVVAFEDNYPLRKKFGDVLTRILEAGLDVKWRSDYEHANKIVKLAVVENTEDEDDTLPLVLKILMLAGVIISFIGLLFEYIWFYYPWLKLKGIEFLSFLRTKMMRKSSKKL